MPVIKPSPGVLNRLRSVFRMREAPTGNSLVVPERQGVVSPEQLTGDDEQLFRALTESGYSLADALEAIRKEGLQAEMSRRDLFRLGRDTAKAGSTLSNLGALRHFVPDLTTSLYPEVSRERIMRTVKPLLERASPQQGWVSSDFPGQTWETDFNIWASGGPWDGDVRYIDPRFEDKLTSYLSKRLKSPAEHEEASALLSDIPMWDDNLRYYVEDGRPKELWSNWLEGEETIPDFSDPIVSNTKVVTPEDLHELSEIYNPNFGELVENMNDMAFDAASPYLSDKLDELDRFIGTDTLNPVSPNEGPTTEIKNHHTWKGRPAWVAVVDILDNEVLGTVSYEDAENQGFHHSFYLSPRLYESVESGNAEVFVDNGNGWEDMSGGGSRKTINRINEQMDDK